MEEWRKNFIIISGFFESLFFSGCVFGWPSLLLVLQEEGIYRHVCKESGREVDNVELTRNAYGNDNPDIELSLNLMGENETIWKSIYYSESEESQVLFDAVGCTEQRIKMTLIYTVAAVVYGIFAVFVGISLEVLGIRLTRFAGSVLLTMGFAVFSCITPEQSWLLWPALNLVALGSNQLRFSTLQFADLKPKYRATILTTYSAAYAISTAFFLVIQVIYETTAAMKLMFIVCTCIASLTFIPTFFMPWQKIEADKDSDMDQVEKVPESEKIIGKHYANNDGNANISKEATSIELLDLRQNHKDAGAGKPIEVEDKKPETSYKKIRSALQSLLSVSGIFHMYWHFINLFLVLFYSSTFNIWAAKITDDLPTVSFYIKMSGTCSLVAPLFIPLSGLITDTMIKAANKQRDPVNKLAYTMQAPTFSMATATICLALTMACKLFIDERAIYISLILIALARPAIIGSCHAYMRLRFPAEQFNIINGVSTTTISILCFVQYPILKWMTLSDTSYTQVHWLLLLALLLSLTSPGHMMIRKNALKYAKQRISP